MKQILLSAVVLFVFQSGNATVRTVSNTPSTLAQYSDIQAAVNASSDGDTVYVHGSPNNYALFTINDKRLVILGPGWRPDKNLAFKAQVAGCTIVGTLASNTEIQGLYIYGNITLGNAPHSDGIQFIRNEIFNQNIYINQGGTTYKDYLFEGNIFYRPHLWASTSTTYQNFLFHNNLFYESATNDWTFTDFNNCINVLFDHNLFYGPSTGAVNVFVNNNRFMTFTNNIFVRRNVANNNSQSVFNNNITFNAGTNNPWAVNSNNDAGGNVENQDPQMVDQTSVNAGTYNPLFDFTIAAGPANNSGADGKDMGLLYDAVGSLNWANSRNSRLPRIFTMNITNPTIPQGGNLNVEVEARKSN